MSWNKSKDFAQCKKMTEPLYPVPDSIQQALDIAAAHPDGIFEIEKDSAKGGRMRMFDRVYEFTDVNYVSKDEYEKEQVCLAFCKFLNTMSVDFKLHIFNEPRDMEELKERILIPEDAAKDASLLAANNQLILDGLEKGEPQIIKRRYLTVTCRRKRYEDAKAYFNVLEAAILPAFAGMESSLSALDAKRRMEILYHFFHLDGRPQVAPEKAACQGRSWKNDVVPYGLNNTKSCLELGEACMQLLFVPTLPNTLDESKVLSELIKVDFFLSVTLDCACIPREILKGKISAANNNNEMAISREMELNAKNKNFASGPSYQKERKQEELKGYMDQVDTNDENGFFLQVLLAVRGRTREEMKKNVETLQLIGSGMGLKFVPDYNQQIQAMNTLLPIGARRVDHMRSMLTSSMVAFQPFHARDLIQPGGTYYGTNKLTKNIIMGDRKKLKNSNAALFGHTGSGKSMFLKITEIGQTYVATEDDIFVIDPQNEMEAVTPHFGGQFFDLTPSSGIYFNPLETPESVLYSTDLKVQARFVADKSDFMEAFVYSCLKGITPNGWHKTLIVRCIKKLYDKVFHDKRPSSPLLSDFREILKVQPEPEARDLYGSLEAYTDGTFDMFAQQSNLDIHARFVVFGMKNANSMWETCMITVMHLLSMRMDYNVNLQRATHFICDEAQYVCKKESSTEQLARAFLTYRKYGGICTVCFQNISAALSNPTAREIVDNCDFKVFLDQGGNDRNALSKILELSSAEFRELANPEPGQCLIVFGNQILQCDAKISKDNPLYDIYNTNFYEKAEKRA